MDDKQGWKEIEEKIKIKDSEIIEKYGFDVREKWNTKPKKEKSYIVPRTKKILIRLFITIIISIALFMSYIGYSYLYDRRQMVNPNAKEMIEIHSEEKLDTVFEDEWENGKGIYIFRIKDEPQIEIHATKNWEKIDDDALQRINKYYFDKWEDAEKDKFIVTESYRDINIDGKIRENWLLEYQTCIVINNYNELIDATEAIIRFINFKGKHRFPAKNIIKIKDLDNTMIWPQHKNPQTDDEIRESAIKQYINIVKGRNMDTNDIPKEVMNKYLNEE